MLVTGTVAMDLAATRRLSRLSLFGLLGVSKQSGGCFMPAVPASRTRWLGLPPTVIPDLSMSGWLPPMLRLHPAVVSLPNATLHRLRVI